MKNYDLIQFKVSHIFYEGNHCAYKLANFETDKNFK